MTEGRQQPDHRKLKVAWIGTGVMGAAMAGHVLAAGHQITVHNRSRWKAKPLLDCGATWAETPAQAADGADVAVSMVAYPFDVEMTHLGEVGTLTATKPPRLLIDMTTSRPSLAVKIYNEAKARGVGSVDAPVSGGDLGARNAGLSIMVGADPADFDLALPLLKVMGPKVIRQGGPGAGQHTKMVNQILIATTMIGLCEGLIYARTAGLDPMMVLDSIGSGAAGSWSVTNLAPRMIQRDFDPGFYVEHFIKDLGIALEECHRMKRDLPGLVLARRLYECTQALGHGRLGTHSLLLAMERMTQEP
jgi:3-hydroxyisobutyrate dehydrogenase